MTKINWKQIPGNKAMTALHPLMLTDEGYLVKRRVSVGRGIETREYLVIYDTDYVYFRFIQLIEQLKFRDIEEINCFLDNLLDRLDGKVPK